MKGESDIRPIRRGVLSEAEAERIALDVFQQIAAEPDRLGRFLVASGLDPGTIRRAAAEPGFLPAILDYICGDEALLIAVAAELGRRPEHLAEAQHRLSPVSDETY